MALLMAPNLDEKVDMLKVLKMTILHDINEAYVGDVPAFASHHSSHKDVEMENMKNLIGRFSNTVMQEIYDVWMEYEEQVSLESKFVKALDKIEVRIQHNEADISTWNEIEYPRSLFTADKYCEYDTFLGNFNEQVKEESRQKIVNESGKYIKEVEQDAEKMRIC